MCLVRSQQATPSLAVAIPRMDQDLVFTLWRSLEPKIRRELAAVRRRYQMQRKEARHTFLGTCRRWFCMCMVRKEASEHQKVTRSAAQARLPPYIFPGPYHVPWHQNFRRMKVDEQGKAMSSYPIFA